MKYFIMRDLVDNTYWIVDRITERADEIKVYESDSLHACFIWFIDKSWEEEGFDSKPNLELHEEVWCVYWSDFSENYYICPDMEDGTLDDVCFRGSEEECNKFFNEHFITEDNFESDGSVFPCDYG